MYAAVALERVLLVVDVERVAEAQSGYAVAQAALTLRASHRNCAAQSERRDVSFTSTCNWT